MKLTRSIGRLAPLDSSTSMLKRYFIVYVISDKVSRDCLYLYILFVERRHGDML